jgi:hypothetical protein
MNIFVKFNIGNFAATSINYEPFDWDVEYIVYQITDYPKSLSC